MHPNKLSLIPLIAASLIFSGCSNSAKDSNTPGETAKVSDFPQKTTSPKSASVTLRYVEFLVPESAATEVFAGKSGYEALVTGSKKGLYEMVTSELVAKNGVPAELRSVKVVHYKATKPSQNPLGGAEKTEEVMESQDVGLVVNASVNIQPSGEFAEVQFEANRTMKDPFSSEFSFGSIKTTVDLYFGAPVLISRLNPAAKANDKRSRIVFLSADLGR